MTKTKAFFLIILMLFIIVFQGACGAKPDAENSPKLTDVSAFSENGGAVDRQWVTADLIFDREIMLKEEPLSNMHITIAGEAVANPSVSRPAEDTVRIRIPVTAVTTGNLCIEEKKEGIGFPGITDLSGAYAILPFSAEILIPTGVTLEDDPSYTGKGVAKTVKGQWNIRCITWMQLLEDGVPVESAVTQSSELFRDGSIAVHGHDFLICDSTMIADIMAETLNQHFGSRYYFYSEGNRLIGEKLEETERGTPDLKIYEYKEIRIREGEDNEK